MVIATVVLVTILVPGAALGAQYTVHACGAGNNNTFFGATSDSRMAARSLCAADADGHRLGVAVLAGVNQGQVPVFANATQTFLAPPGTTISHVHLKADARTSNGDWAALLQASTDRFSSGFWTVAGCLPRAGDSAGCSAASPKVDQDHDFSGATGFRSIVACGNFAGCGTFTTGTWPFARAYYLMHQVDVTLEDNSPPGVSITGGGLAESGWVRGSQRVFYDAGDNSGVFRTQLVVDDTVFDHADRPCDYTFAAPCTGVFDDSYLLNTASIGDGPHRITIAAYDATNVNRGTAVRTVWFDNNAPSEPTAAAVADGEGWHTNDDFTVTWTNPGSTAPITRALYEICRVGGNCVTGEQSGDGISRLTGLHVGQPGDYTIRIRLADAAGNVSDARSAPLHLKFDNVPPGQAAPQRRNGWLNSAEAKSYVQEINKPEGFQFPVSGIAGYATTVDGTAPGLTPDVAADPLGDYSARKALTNLPEGTSTFKARAVSGAGLPSTSIGLTDIRVDLTAPVLTLSGAPNSEHWSRTPSDLTITAIDPGNLSGMAGAPADRPPDAGGHISFEVDGDKKIIPGPPHDAGPDGTFSHEAQAEAHASISGDGIHRLVYGATDVAGNVAAEKSVILKIDRTPPELAVFEAQSPSDPRLLAVAASDRTSGLADGGRIELRRISPSRGDWVTVSATRREDHYYAHIENATMPEGEYEVRGIIPDQAGNDAVATADREGRAELLHISPTQIGSFSTVGLDQQVPQPRDPDAPDAKATVRTAVGAWAVQRATVSKKCSRSRRRRRHCPRPQTHETLVHDLRLGFHRGVTIRGHLKTAGGAVLPGAEIVVLARPSMVGRGYAAEASVRTNARGTFSYQAAAGPSRILDFHYAGTDRYKHSDDQVTIRVPASATIAVSRHAVRNGKAVVFAGRLRGQPYPPKGKVLDLQAYYRRRWRTFATPRAGSNGRWKYRYRFQATRGSIQYRFRLHIRATSDYPYEAAYSRTVAVRVRP